MFILQRPAVAMLELIFAIVIMGIVLMSAPMLISTAAKTTSVVLQQEGINQASSRINMILTYPWDQNDTNDSCTTPPALHVTNGHVDLGISATTKRRLGVPINSNSHTSKCGNLEFWASNPLVIDGLDDIDDFISVQTLNDVGGPAGGKDYLEQDTVQITTAISYLSDTLPAAANYNNTATITYNATGAVAANQSTNIKQIAVTITTSSAADVLDKNITLNAFSCNLGGIEYATRIMP